MEDMEEKQVGRGRGERGRIKAEDFGSCSEAHLHVFIDQLSKFNVEMRGVILSFFFDQHVHSSQ